MVEQNVKKNNRFWITIFTSIGCLLFGSGIVLGIYSAGSTSAERRINVKNNKESIQRLEMSIANLTTDSITTKISFTRVEEILKNVLENQKETLKRLDRIEQSALNQ